MTGAYYNDNDQYCAAWLRNLIAAGHLPAGDVDERPIQEVQASDLSGYDQCHFFAGLGGWAYALRLAEWGDRPVWTGSCPCQPFSAAGKQRSHADARHLWPAWFRLIAECRPERLFGEQVSGAAGLGWLDAVRADLESKGYAVGFTVLGAHSVGAPHLRQRLWFVADSRCEQRGEIRTASRENQFRSNIHHQRCGADGGLADALPAGRPEGRAGTGDGQASCGGESGELGHAALDGPLNGESSESDGRQGEAGRSSIPSLMGHAPSERCGEARDTSGRPSQRTGDAGAANELAHAAGSGRDTRLADHEARQLDTAWSGADWLPCRDGKARPAEPGTFPLAHGVPARVGRLRAYGNAICPQTAEAFIGAYLGVVP